MLHNSSFKGSKNSEFNKLDRAFIGTKVSTVRWKPEKLGASPNYFVTGNYDEEVGNSLQLWNYPDQSSEMEQDFFQALQVYPLKLHQLDIDGSVLKIKFLNNEKFIFTTSLGTVGIASVYTETDEKGASKLQQQHLWENIHSLNGTFNMPCNSLDIFENDLVTGGDDGKLYVLNCEVEKPILEISATGSAITSLQFSTKFEIISTDRKGHIKIWDTRQTAKPTSVFPYSQQKSAAVMCSAIVPSQKHVLLAGGESGDINIWDTRSLPLPLVLFNSHENGVTDMIFHQEVCTNLFTSSVDGEVWHWSNMVEYINSSTRSRGLNTESKMETNEIEVERSYRLGDSELGLNWTRSAKDLQPSVTSLMARKNFTTNCLDIAKEQLICGTDNECVVIIKPLVIK